MENEQLSMFSSTDIKSQIEDLRKQIEYHNKRYYEDDNPEISDYEYDMLNKKLKELESLHPEYVVTTSPTQKVGGKVNNMFTEVKHDVLMQSLQDVFDYKEVEDFVNKVINEYGSDIQFQVSTKIDGLSVSLEYENGILVRGSTRGNGQVGEDVTQNLLQLKDIPNKLKTNDTIEVRGEVYLPREEFEKINVELEKQGKSVLANPRNAAAGTLRQLNPELVKSRNLSIFIFNVQKSTTKKFLTHSESLEYCKSIGIKVLDYSKVCVGVKNVIEYIKEIGKIRDSLKYDIDGAVVTVNNLKIREEMGKTSKVPKWAVAFKYPPEQRNTKVLNIIVQVGRTGVVTPMAILEPVKVAGSVISKTTLHNFDYIKEKDIRIGDTCLIQKAGDVIPEIVKVVKEKRDGAQKEYEVPKICPVCGENLEKEEDTVALRCTNSECPALLYRSLIHFVSRDAMDIVGLGEAIIDRFIELGYLKDIADIYYIKYEDILKLDRFDKKSAINLINSIEKSKSNPLDKVIFGLGIRHIGKKAANILCKKFESIEEIMNATIEEINSLEDYGQIMAESVYTFFRKKETIKLIDKLKAAGVNMLSEKVTVSSEILKDKNICITGSFENYTRDDIVKIIEENAGKFVNSVSKKTSFLISGEDSGSKLKKANELGINILTIDEFLKLIENKS